MYVAKLMHQFVNPLNVKNVVCLLPSFQLQESVHGYNLIHHKIECYILAEVQNSHGKRTHKSPKNKHT